jgi:hypothetical protein
MMVPPRMVAPQLDTDLPSSNATLIKGLGVGGIKRKPMLGNPLLSKRQRHGDASSPASRLLPRSSHTRYRSMSPRLR